MVKTYDAYGNACEVGGAAIALDGPAVSRGDVSFRVDDSRNGEYTVFWSSRYAGEHSVRILLNGQPLTGPMNDVAGRTKPRRAGSSGGGEAVSFDEALEAAEAKLAAGDAEEERGWLSLGVRPNSLCARTTAASGEALTRIVAGERSMIRVHGLDRCGNAVDPAACGVFDLFLWHPTRGRRILARDLRSGSGGSWHAGGGAGSGMRL